MIGKGQGNPCPAYIKGRSGEAQQDAWQTHPRKPRRPAPGSRRPARARKPRPESPDAAAIPRQSLPWKPSASLAAWSPRARQTTPESKQKTSAGLNSVL